jgi:nucleoside-diphosphate kinase
MEYTLAIIKPDVIKRKLSGSAISIIERAFNIKEMKLMRWSKKLASKFYEEHKEKVFFEEMIGDMICDDLIIMILCGDNVISKWRDFIGATDPQKAESHTLRYSFGLSIGLNSFHGSLTSEDAKREIDILFPTCCS